MNLLNLAERFGERLQSPVSKVHLSQSRLHAGAIHHKPRGGVWQGTIDMVLPLKRQFPLRTYGRQITQPRPNVNGAQMGERGTSRNQYHLTPVFCFQCADLQAWLPLEVSSSA